MTEALETGAMEVPADSATEPGESAVPDDQTDGAESASPKNGPLAAGRLAELGVRNLALIERLSISFEPGLNVLTGETGAGKSLLIDALGLAIGARADTSLVRHGVGPGPCGGPVRPPAGAAHLCSRGFCRGTLHSPSG